MKTSWKKILVCMVLTVLLLLFLTACNKKEKSNTLLVTDCSGAKVTLTKNICKVISVDASFTDFMVAMGLSDKLVGIHGSIWGDTWSPIFMGDDLTHCKRFGYKPSAEAIYELEADLVVLNDAEYADELRRVGVPAIYFGYDNLDELYYATDVISQLFGDVSQKYILSWKERLDSTVSKLISENAGIDNSDKKNVYYINASNNPSTLYSTFGGNSFTEYWINTIGANLVTSPYQNISAIEQECALSLNPDTIVIAGYAEHSRKEELLADPLWGDIDAVKNDRIYLIPKGFVGYENFAVELPLMLEYSANLLYPTVHSFDYLTDAYDFFNTFYHKDLSTEQLYYLQEYLNTDGSRMD